MDPLFHVVRPAAATPRIVDIGCGKGHLLVEAVRRLEALGTGVDLDISECAALVQREGLDHRVQLIEADAGEAALGTAFDVSISVGAAHVYGGYVNTLRHLRDMTAPNGYVVFGDGYWATDPTESALSALDAQPDELGTLGDIVDTGLEMQLTPAWARVSSMREWDDYEFAWARNLFDYAADHPGDPDAAGLSAIAREHLVGYVHGYRGVLGFVVTAFRREP